VKFCAIRVEPLLQNLPNLPCRVIHALVLSREPSQNQKSAKAVFLFCDSKQVLASTCVGELKDAGTTVPSRGELGMGPERKWVPRQGLGTILDITFIQFTSPYFRATVISEQSNNLMEKNQFELMLAENERVMQKLVDDFRAGLSVFKQNQLSSHIALIERQMAARQKKCKDEYEEEKLKIQNRKNGQTSPLLLNVYDRAEESLERRYVANLISIKEFCEESISVL
jgi:hypothetical protein